MIKRFAALFCLVALAGPLCAQDNFFERWEARTTRTQSKQPQWAPPVVAPFVALIQVYRSDFTRQITPTGATVWNYDTSKGLNLIPWANTEIDINLPPFLDHSAPNTKDGFGDVSFLGKYRILTGNEKHGNYAVSFMVTGTIPTGSYSNGSADATVNPTLGLGKGFGKFNIQSCLGATLPTGDTKKLGRPVLWNITGQYHLGKYLWPEVEFNSTYYHGGPNDGKTQTFATPGFTVGRLKINHDPKSRLGIGLGGGMQIATSEFHTYNHGLVFTGRFLF